MFSKLDDNLIVKAQWLVRQVEIFTPLTRRFLGYTILLVNMLIGLFVLVILSYLVIGIIKAVVGTETELLAKIIVGTLVGLLFYIHVETYFVATEHLAKEQPANTLPYERIGRKRERLILFILFVVFWWAVMLIGSQAAKDGADYVVILLSYIIFEGGLVTRIVLEYLFCTTSLPPGEKEKRKQEKKAEQLTLQPSV